MEQAVRGHRRSAEDSFVHHHYWSHGVVCTGERKEEEEEEESNRRARLQNNTKYWQERDIARNLFFNIQPCKKDEIDAWCFVLCPVTREGACYMFREHFAFRSDAYLLHGYFLMPVTCCNDVLYNYVTLPAEMSHIATRPPFGYSHFPKGGVQYIDFGFQWNQFFQSFLYHNNTLVTHTHTQICKCD